MNSLPSLKSIFAQDKLKNVTGPIVQPNTPKTLFTLAEKIVGDYLHNAIKRVHLVEVLF